MYSHTAAKQQAEMGIEALTTVLRAFINTPKDKKDELKAALDAIPTRTLVDFMAASLLVEVAALGVNMLLFARPDREEVMKQRVKEVQEQEAAAYVDEMLA